MSRIKKQEENLMEQIRSYKEELRRSAREEFFRERDEKHSRNNIFYKGAWIPRDRIERASNEISSGGLAVFLEVTIFFSMVLFVYYFIWSLFSRFILP